TPFGKRPTAALNDFQVLSTRHSCRPSLLTHEARSLADGAIVGRGAPKSNARRARESIGIRGGSLGLVRSDGGPSERVDATSINASTSRRRRGGCGPVRGGAVDSRAGG